VNYEAAVWRLSASLGERYITKFIDDEELDSGELGLEL
jgi:hypothetical protein